MKKAMWIALATAPLLALAACSSGPDVRAMQDPSANFASYQTFGFENPLGTDKAGYQSIVSQHLKSAAQREMEARGYRYDAANPHLLVNFNATLNDKMRVDSYPAPVMAGGYYGFRAGLYQPWPMYANQTEVTQYQEGTLTIDVVDAAKKQLVWEGTVTKSISSSDTKNVPAALDSAVSAAFAKFPTPRAAAAPK
ncbi:DUF4136 domain-containing protein [Sandaracinobacteroides hominis]|uniref:DUF4136 domain-containing protein n=1 Tax=Sandaracinobacteroides hominis TaxID=2780086 RepID=UPI0018F52EFF|nr:DUF4136 domain-containing protein [Sandaracinobacteroides hominis]